MNQPVFLNGDYVPRRDARFDPLDRGTLFGDGVYEVVRYVHGKPFAMGPHLARLEQSLAAIDLPSPMPPGDLAAACDELVRRRGLADAKLYLQVTRGPAERNFVMPSDPSPTVLAVADPAGRLDPSAPPAVSSLRAVDDHRWGDCWIKSLMLLPASLAKTRAVRAGFDDALFVKGFAERGDAGVVTEATSANAFFVIGGVLRTHGLGRAILPGVTRAELLRLAADADYAVDETPLTLAEVRRADEMMLTSTTRGVTAVGRLDGVVFGDGGAGPVTRNLHRRFVERMLAACGG